MGTRAFDGYGTVVDLFMHPVHGPKEDMSSRAHVHREQFEFDEC